MRYFEMLVFVNIIRLEIALGELQCLKYNIYMLSVLGVRSQIKNIYSAIQETKNDFYAIRFLLF